jgi:GGDEF domain-containing protein
LLALARASDRVTRLSGSRFGVLLLEADEEAAELYADRAMATCETWLDSSAFEMRMSMGWAVARGPEELLGALRSAEEQVRAED